VSLIYPTLGEVRSFCAAPAVADRREEGSCESVVAIRFNSHALEPKRGQDNQ
jgi:hypothetical protein